MELKELKEIVEENFYDRFEKDEYKLVLIGEDKNIKHLCYMVVYGNSPYIWFKVCTTSVYEAVSTQLLSSVYDTKQWYYFLTNMKEALHLVWERENNA